MNRQYWHRFGLLLLGLSLVAASSVPAEPPPVFLTKWGTQGSGDGQFDTPVGVAVDASGNVWVADYGNNRIQKFDSSGSFLSKWGSYGTGDGQFDSPIGVAVDASGTVYVAELYNHRIQKFDSNGTFLAKWGTWGSGDGQFDRPRGVAVDASGNVYVADTYNHRIQKFGSTLTTVFADGFETGDTSVWSLSVP